MKRPVPASQEADQPYPPIDSYAFIGDCHSGALISRTGSIDWCCLPRFDSASVFGRLLDWDRGGYCAVTPCGEYDTSRDYVDGTLVLSTVFRTESGEVELVDCFTMREGGAREPHRQLLRVIEGRRGTVRIAIEIVPRFDYGDVKPWLRRHVAGAYTAIGGDDAMVVTCDAPLSLAELHTLRAECTVEAGQRIRLSLQSVRPEVIDPHPPRQASAAELDRRLDETVAWWQQWASKTSLEGPYAAGARRSAVVLKGLTHAPTGAVAAALTTSLPEAIGKGRNWDYRYSWIRDSHFTVRSLSGVGCHTEADGFRRFVQRSAAASVESLQIMYGVGGERRLTELTLKRLEGYRSSKPVRIGNAASSQLQLDVFGELLDLAWLWHLRGSSPDEDYWRFLVGVVDFVADNWRRPDHGLWEVRGRPRHYVHSKAMCWVALDRGIRLAESLSVTAPVERWCSARDAVRRALDQRGYNPRLNSFVQFFGSDELDAALLLLPAFGVLPYDDARMVGTIDAIQTGLDDGGFVRRYFSDDRLDGREGAFLACTFWLVDCLAHLGRLGEARAAFERAMVAANDVGLFAEEYDPAEGLSLGNYPQALTHLSQITAAVALTQADSAGPGVGTLDTEPRDPG